MYHLFGGVLSLQRLKILSVLLLLPAGLAQGIEPFPADANQVSIGQQLPGRFEASGIAWHSGRREFFVVSDCGMLCNMTEAGQLLQCWDTGKDLEAVTVADQQSDDVYLGVEHPDSVCEFNIKTGRITRTFDLTPWMDGPENSGLEALAFVPQAGDPEGGLFYAGLQDTGQIFVFRLPIISGGVSAAVTHTGTISSVNGVRDISDLCYVPSQRALYAIYDKPDLLRLMETDGTILGQWRLPGRDQEGIAVKGDQLFICEDYGGSSGGNIFRYAPFAVLPQPDLDADGVVDMQDLAVLAEYWAAWQPAGMPDVNGDGFFDLEGFARICGAWLAGK
jgi:hypothetical protein